MWDGSLVEAKGATDRRQLGAKRKIIHAEEAERVWPESLRRKTEGGEGNWGRNV
jgi:hypothetical protein